MRFTLKRRLYESAPGWALRPVGWLPFSLWAGPHYRRRFHQERGWERAERAAIVDRQRAELGAILTYATENVPAYASLHSVVKRLDPFDAIQHFPLLRKEDLQERWAEYLPRSIERIPHYESTTGGTTGNQLRILVDDDSQAVEMAFMHCQWARVGYSPKDRKATFRGVEFPGAADGVFWRRNPIYNELQLSPFHMNETTLPLYWERILEFKPRFLHGYPSAVGILAGWIRRNDVAGRELGLRAVLLGSEAVDGSQRTVIEEAFGARVFSWYGHSERTILAGECEETAVYHQLPGYGYCEVISPADGRIAEDGDSGELVGTGFFTKAMPLIRYRTGDLARKREWQCACGRGFARFDSVEGRWRQEFVIGSGGSRISTAALNMHGSMFDRVARYQYHQRSAGEITLRVMVTAGFGEADETALLEAYRRRLGTELAVKIEVVEEIPLTARGKLRRLVQEIQAEDTLPYGRSGGPSAGPREEVQ